MAILASSLLGAHTTTSVAEESSVSELVEAVVADTTGSEAYASLTNVAGFNPDGGEALFEPGTPNEERFQYTSVDPDANRLVGFVRPVPLDHPAGAVVQADPSDPAATPSPESSPSDEPESSDEGGDPSASSTGDAVEESSAAESESASVDSAVIDEVVDAVGGAVGSPCGSVNCGEIVDDPCARVSCEIDGVRDPCDPSGTGQTCMQYVTENVAQILDNGTCDPYGTGQTCEEYVINTLASMIQTPELFCSEYGKEFVLDPTGHGCVAFVRALDPGSPPQDCGSRVEMGLICAAYGATLIGGSEFGGEVVGDVPAQPTEIGGIALPPPASGPGSNLKCWDGWHRFHYKNGRDQLVGYGRVDVSWCGNDGTNRIRYFDPDYSEWVRSDWSAVLEVSFTQGKVVCEEHDAHSGYCKQRTAWSLWDVYKGWCPYCQRRTPTMFYTAWWQGASSSNAEGY